MSLQEHSRNLAKDSFLLVMSKSSVPVEAITMPSPPALDVRNIASVDGMPDLKEWQDIVSWPGRHRSDRREDRISLNLGCVFRQKNVKQALPGHRRQPPAASEGGV